MAEVGVHLDDDRRAASGDVAEAVQIGPPESFLCLAVENRDIGPFGRQPIGDGSGSVGRVVVHDQDVSFRHGGQNRLRHGTDVVLLVVRG